MAKTIVLVIMCFILLGVMWYPGFMLARNMVRAVGQTEPTVGDTILACIPGLNLAVSRKQLYGKATLVYVMFVLSVVAVIQRFVFYLAFPDAIMASFISLILTWVILFLTWITYGYILWDIGTCIQAGFVTKLCGFIMPPLACFILGKNCIPIMNSMYSEMGSEED